jgi:hypothetical protein
MDLLSCEFSVKSGAVVPTAGAPLAADEDPIADAIARTATTTNAIELSFIFDLVSDFRYTH